MLRTWILSNIVPFGGRMVVEGLGCAKEVAIRFVGIRVNDAVQPLKFCGGVGGLCCMENQWYAKHNGNGDFEKVL
ncbi:hypothetical protein BJY52DRAFT_1309785 [Lactarius psammicola]|nr:hypothetical protein BJY52DRAFT_1309785 [Lactarius psammicola]